MSDPEQRQVRIRKMKERLHAKATKAIEFHRHMRQLLRNKRHREKRHLAFMEAQKKLDSDG